MLASKSKISLFIPCLVDQLYPEMGIAMANILAYLGYDLHYDERQTCCGQPAFNAGHREEAKRVAINFINVFQSAEVVVGPTGSCTAMVRNYYPLLFKEHELEKDANQLAKKIYEFSEFLEKEDRIKHIEGSYSGNIGFHNSCHSYRELRIEHQPLKILNKIKGLKIIEPAEEQVCCGFGGLFSFKYDKIAAAMANSRLQQFIDLKIDLLISNDPGCIMHMRQEAKERKIGIEIIHLVEFLARVMNLDHEEPEIKIKN
jgi:L-lactate dehydrogenase complex protein LldE